MVHAFTNNEEVGRKGSGSDNAHGVVRLRQQSYIAVINTQRRTLLGRTKVDREDTGAQHS